MACAKCVGQVEAQSSKKCEGSAVLFFSVGPMFLFFKVQVVPKLFTCLRGKSLLVECHPLDDQIVRGPITANVRLGEGGQFKTRALSHSTKLNKMNETMITNSPPDFTKPLLAEGTIKANELRIGNLHETVGLDIPRMSISSVRIDKKSFSAITGYGIHLVETGAMPFIPIPLSIGWILKLGLTKLDNTEAALAIEISDTNTLVYDAGEFHLSEDWEYFTLKQIKYVHELQNLYFALSGKELSDK